MNSSKDEEGSANDDAESASAVGTSGEAVLTDTFEFDDPQFPVSDFSEVDFDYENVNSPGASSTSSEPVYIRQPGFDYHAHQFKITNTCPNPKDGGHSGGVIIQQLVPINPAGGQGRDIPFSSSITEGSRVPSQASYFPSPPQTPLSLFSPIQSPLNYLDPLNPQVLRTSPEISTRLVHPLSSHKYAKPSPSEDQKNLTKSRTGNHTPPGESSGKGTKKKKPNTSSSSEQSRDGTPEVTRPAVKSRNRIKREPLPMKLRALPQSFWTQPNRTNNLPPSCSVLPPLIIGKEVSEVIEGSTISPTGERDFRGDRPTERMIKVGNTDLLFRLFDTVEKDEKKKSHVVRRGRPRKTTTNSSKSAREEDPCLVSTATESILPLLPDRTAASSGSSTPLGLRQAQGQQILELVNLKEGDRTVSLPSLNSDHGYSQLLSELVLRL